MIIIHILIGIVVFSIAWLIVVGTMYGISKLIATCIVSILVKKKGSKE